ncbi:calcium-activated potassium channel subunit alpha-1-like [Chanos chanos]|uniref:Calcium-activated potassium channel subunit alpha-1-like n=1 Tax=Chanos chanos TaxID=29144 RepID=A0A6J2WTU8_CHACN|nr:calcium-activated potassium channel subunit alpha-1-like [Chanos chanos]
MEVLNPENAHLYLPHCRYAGYRIWWVYFCSSLAVFLGGLLVLSLTKAGIKGFNRIGVQWPRYRQGRLRFSRALQILEIPVILQIFCITNNNTFLKLSRLCAIVLGTLLTFAGLIHLLENSGDPWLNYSNAHSLSYFECFYFLIVTTSTVGYGDVEVTTTLGRSVIIMFISIALSVFASFVPLILQIILNRKRFGGSYTGTSGKTHVVVCGHLTLANASVFMNEFLHEDRGEINVHVVFLGNFCPDQELEAFFRRRFLQVTFYQGSVLQPADQERVLVQKASACLILCDRFTTNQNNEDAANLMRVISVKQYCPRTRVIVQMLRHSSKAYLQNVPNWDWARGDAVICLAELKLGFMAQSCIVPGLSTLLANLFTMQSEVEDEEDSWKKLYRQGLYNEIYTEFLSSSFTGMSFAEASKLCFLKLKLLLIGIEYQSSDTEFSVLVNPPTHVKIKNQTLGFLIADNATDAKSPGQDIVHSQDSEDVRLDSTGMFHWCPPVPLKDVTLDRHIASALCFKNHILVCLFGDENSSLLGLGDFMMPLRASSLTLTELHSVVFLGDPAFFAREWPNVHCFPHIYFLPGSPLCGADLRVLRVDSCMMCVVLSAFGCSGNEEPPMQDKDTILACVKLYHTRFNQELSHNHDQASLYYEMLMVLVVEAWWYVTWLSNQWVGSGSLVSTAIGTFKCGTDGSYGPSSVNMSNIPYLNEADTREDVSHVALTQAFAVGSVFSADLLDSLMAANTGFSMENTELALKHERFYWSLALSAERRALNRTTYFNMNVPALICTLVTGGDTPLLEAQLAEDNQLREGKMSPKLRSLRQRSKLAQLALKDEPLCQFSALDSLDILCFGLYRLLDPPNPTVKRFVITNPPAELRLLPSDKVFCSVPFHQSHLLTRARPHGCTTY